MADRCKQVVIFGHSFVTHFESFLESSPTRWNLGLDTDRFSVHLHGIRGLTLKDARLYSADKGLEGADLVIIDIGSNDVADPAVDCNRVAIRLVAFAEYVLYGLEAKSVVLSFGGRTHE